MQHITIKNNKTSPLIAGHPWVFSGALLQRYDYIDPQVVSLLDESGKFLAYGFYNKNQSICFRVISFDINEIDVHKLNNDISTQEDFFYIRLTNLANLKKSLISEDTNGFRLVNSDADYMPGLTIDIYDNVAVFAVSLYAMEKFIEPIIKSLSKMNFDIIIEKSDSNARKIENLPIKPTVVHRGKGEESYVFAENSIKMLSNPMEGQKSGFFLDQRNTRLWLKNNCKDKKVVNLFSYSGGFSISALLGGAKEVVSVDISPLAIKMCNEIINLNDDGNGLLLKKHKSIVSNVLHYLKEDWSCDIIVCDPPAFAKKKDSLKNAFNAYVSLNVECMKKITKGGILITSSCSGLLKMDDFISVIKKASLLSNKHFMILNTMYQDVDHTRLLGFAEGEYLKTLILQVV